MNTYIFHPPPFEKTAKVLKKVHAVQQMYRAIQLYRTIQKPKGGGGFRELPVTIAWEQYQQALAAYIAAFAKVLGEKAIHKEYKKLAGTKVNYPAFATDKRYHNLCRFCLRDGWPISYGHLWPQRMYTEFKGMKTTDYFPKTRPFSIKIKVTVKPQPPKAPIITEPVIEVAPAEAPEDLYVSGTEDAQVGIGSLLDSIQSLRDKLSDVKG